MMLLVPKQSQSERLEPVEAVERSIFALVSLEERLPKAVVACDGLARKKERKKSPPIRFLHNTIGTAATEEW